MSYMDDTADGPARMTISETVDLCGQAIALFLEYRDSYGYDEDTAKSSALCNVLTGLHEPKPDYREPAEVVATDPPGDCECPDCRLCLDDCHVFKCICAENQPAEAVSHG